MKSSWILIAVVLGLLLMAPGLEAATITVGTQSPGLSNCIPFGCPGGFGVSTFQEVYSSSAFPGPISILAITFFNDLSLTFSPHEVTPANYTFNFSTTSKSVGGLDTANLNNNVGLDNQVFFTGALGGLLPADGEFTVIGMTAFIYDPSAGNLLLDISISGAGPDVISFFVSDNTGTLVSRAYTNIGPFPWNALTGLVTRFEVTSTPIPEPSTMLLLGSGLIGLAGYGRKRFFKK